MGFLKLSKILLVERGSISFKLSETANLESSTEALKEIKTLLTNLRQAQWPDKGISFDLVDTKRFNSHWENVLLKTVDFVLSKNVVGLDLWINIKPSKQVKTLVSIIRKKIGEEKTNFIRIRPYICEKPMKKVALTLTFLGLCMIIGAEFLPQSDVVLWQAKFKSNFIQMTGFLAGLLPWVLPALLNKLKNWKNKEGTT